MDLKLKDNSLLSLGSTISSAITANCTTIYVKDCPNISGINILRQCTNLTRVRLDIGNVSGSIEELLSYTSLNGFNDNYESQVKPRLVGTYTVNDWYLPEQLIQAQAAFDGLTVIGDSSKEIVFSDLAIQTLDNTKPNYNPAAAIVLQSNSKGVTLDNPIISGQTGRWFMTINQAETMPQNLSLFYNKINVSDVNNIVNASSDTYVFTSFNEFKYFKKYNQLGGSTTTMFQGCSLLRYFTTPGTITIFNGYSNSGNSGNNQIVYINEAICPTVLSTQGPAGFIYPGKSNNRYILSAHKDKYRAQQLLLQWQNQVKFSDSDSCSQIKTYYDYCAPKISYNGTNITMTVARASTIHYTIDGSTPTIESTKYTEPFVWNGQGVIKAMAIDTTNIVGDIAYAQDFYANTTADPIITYTATQVTISSEQGATIYYTLDGTCPTEDSDVYSEPILVSGDIIKVRCFARVASKNDSNLIGKICVLDDTLWGTDGDSSYFAVQCIDSTKPNYNPAVCILLFLNSLVTDYCITGGCYLSKQCALNKTSKNLKTVFVSKTTFSDRLCVVSNNPSATYDFETFNEFKYFGAFPNPDSGMDSSNCGFMNCTKLREITLPPINDLSITPSSWARNAFSGCSKLETINNLEYVNSLPNGFASGCLLLKNFTLSTNITSIGSGAFYNVAKNATITANDYIELNLPNLTTLGVAAFCSCKVIRKIINLGSITKLELQNNYDGTFYNSPIIEATLPSTITKIQNYNFYAISANAVIHLLSTTPPTISNTSAVFYPASVKLYVGDGSSASNDDAILQTYLADTKWATFSSRLDTWYNYLHPTT